MILNKKDSIYIANRFADYFSKYNRIDDYFRLNKTERIEKISPTLPGYEPHNMLFSDFDMHPEDMQFEIFEPSASEFSTMVDITSSFCNENSFGKEIKFIVKEKNTGKYVGFCRIASPIINSKPRNDWIGKTPDLKIFNKHAVMGFIIVPAQPFGFNYLGGKLLALLCTSHEIREMFDSRYDTQTCLFETTSLYGNIKQVSQYDGLKPFIKHIGDTQSDFILSFAPNFWQEVMDWFSEKNGGEPLFSRTGVASYKLKMQNKMTQVILNSLKIHDKKMYDKFKEEIKQSKSQTTKKRFYISTYGYENTKDVLLGNTNTLVKGQNFDKHYMENIISWWKRKSSSRYENLKAEGRLRKELEHWCSDTADKIDIIR